MLAVHDVEPFRAARGRHDRHTVREGLEDLEPGPPAVADGDDHGGGLRQLFSHVDDRPDQVQPVDAIESGHALDVPPHQPQPHSGQTSAQRR